MDAFPAFIPLSDRRVVVVGEGETADNKARLFDGSPARLDRLTLDEAQAPCALSGATLVFVAGPDEAARAVAALARAAGALVNVVDAPALGDFTTPSIVDRGRVVGAVGTDGSAPVLAVRLRQQLERLWPAGLGALAQVMGEMRGPAKVRFPDMAERRAWLRTLIDGPVAKAAFDGRDAEALTEARASLERTGERGGGWVSVLTVPAALDDVTLGAARILGDADVLVVVGPVPPEIVALARRDATRIPLDDADPSRLSALAQEGQNVVVLCDADFAPFAEALAR